jgi:PEP-CTERM motif
LFNLTPVPEPGTFAMVGVVVFAGWRFRSKTVRTN